MKWEDKSGARYGVYFERIHFVNSDGEKCLVIYNEFTHGGKAGLLEVMPPLHRDPDYDDNVQGWLTAEEIIDAWVRG